ncbi:MAG: 4Fe-4S dicluster domain-containing protein [Bacillota bacterium]
MLVAEEEKCTGCKICQLICSWTNHKTFNPRKAYIQVIVDEKRARFSLAAAQECTECKACIAYCPNGALKIKEGVS